MGALRQARFDTGRKGPAVETTTGPKLDRYGRDPESLPEKLRAQTNYEADTGYGPAYHAAIVDLTRLASGGICWAFAMVVNALSYGRPRDAKGPRQTSTLPVTTAELAELCRCNIKGVQRQIDEMQCCSAHCEDGCIKHRGMFQVKAIKQGANIRYIITPLYAKWRALEDYAVWARRQVVELDAAGDDDATDDTEALPISKDAVHLTKKRVTVRPGRSTKAAAIKNGVNSYKVLNANSRVDVNYEAVIDSGCFVLTLGSQESAIQPKSEDKANVGRHGCRVPPPNGGSQEKRSKGETPPRAADIKNIFDPLLQRSGSKLLAFDDAALALACAELGALPVPSLEAFLFAGTSPRGSRPISSPRAVAAIVKEARLNWESAARSAPAAVPESLCAKCGAALSGGSTFTPGVGLVCFGCAV